MTRCPNCGKVQDVVGLAPGGGPLHFCPACGLLSIVDAAALEGLRMPTRAERNAAASDPEVQLAKAQFMELHAKPKRHQRRARQISGSTRIELLVLTAAVLVILALALGYRLLNGG